MDLCHSHNFAVVLDVINELVRDVLSELLYTDDLALMTTIF